MASTAPCGQAGTQAPARIQVSSTMRTVSPDTAIASEGQARTQARQPTHLSFISKRTSGCPSLGPHHSGAARAPTMALKRRIVNMLRGSSSRTFSDVFVARIQQFRRPELPQCLGPLKGAIPRGGAVTVCRDASCRQVACVPPWGARSVRSGLIAEAQRRPPALEAAATPAGTP